MVGNTKDKNKAGKGPGSPGSQDGWRIKREAGKWPSVPGRGTAPVLRGEGAQESAAQQEATVLRTKQEG